MMPVTETLKLMPDEYKPYLDDIEDDIFVALQEFNELLKDNEPEEPNDFMIQLYNIVDNLSYAYNGKSLEQNKNLF